MREKKVVIIGAGAAGLMCASQLPLSMDVTVLERMDSTGKKLLATGNGRCNLTNRKAEKTPEAFYHGDSAFAGQVIRSCPPSVVLDKFLRLGLDTVTEPGSGLVYPASYQAKSVWHILNYRCELNHVNFVTGCTVRQILPDADPFSDFTYLIKTDRGDFPAHYVVLAAGGRSGTGLGSDGSAYALASALGHTVTPQFPALVQLKSSSKYPKQLKGTRVRGRLTIEIDATRRGEQEGEILFTAYGLSGICTMELSRLVSEACAKDPACRITGILDLQPGRELAELKAVLSANVRSGFAPEMALSGMLPLKLALLIGAQAGNDTDRMAEITKSWRLPLTGTLGFPHSQVTCGGVATAQVKNVTLESKLHPNLYLLGELLNTDGDCGGYNLQFAWSCGILAAGDITLKYNNENRNGNQND